MAPTPHWHVAHGISGYGPDGDENTPTFETLSEALEYAHDELLVDIDMAHEDAHAAGDAGNYEDAWNSILLVEKLENLRANLSPTRKSAPLYANDPVAYAALQETQAAEFPIDVVGSSRLYLWDCSEAECLEGDDVEWLQQQSPTGTASPHSSSGSPPPSSPSTHGSRSHAHRKAGANDAHLQPRRHPDS